ncbi:hypothetical protein ILUMI_08214 [Ignelater luminosus]|uniref:Uncharacterized protein n=1 Tax=Ignelater luminosus TaxID=2038154 RepID=A0A8K0D6I6_IGNLU|nr:hypothetical protein ILUMI_08214 [Ignelater luminosus]
MRRVKESGAWYRNKKKARQEIIRKNEGAILKFVKTSKSESMPRPSDVSSSAQNQEEAEVVQVPDRDDLLRPVIGSTNLSASHASAAIAEIDFDGNDIGKWPENIDSNIRLLLIQRGPEVVQHINTDFTKEPTISRSVQSDTDAITSKVLSRRRLTREWFLPHVDKRRKSTTHLDGLFSF